MHSILTAIAATISLAVVRLFRLPEAYWAAIATLVVMQSTLGATLLISVERVVAGALGALAGALGNLVHRKSSYLRGCGILLGLLCAAFRMEKSAYRYASITLAIIVFIPRWNAPGSLRSTGSEVSVGIVVALAAVWPEHQPGLQNKSSSKLPCSGGRVARDPCISQPTRLPLQKIR